MKVILIITPHPRFLYVGQPRKIVLTLPHYNQVHNKKGLSMTMYPRTVFHLPSPLRLPYPRKQGVLSMRLLQEE